MPTNQFGVTEFDADPETAAELIRLKRKQAIADAMMQGGKIAPAGRMAGRVFVPSSLFENLGGLAEQYVAKEQQGQVEKDYTGLADKRRAVQEAALEKYRQGISGTPARPAMVDPQEMEQSADQGTPMPPEIPAQPATKEQRMNAIIEAAASANPRLAGMAQMQFKMDEAAQARKDAAQARIDQINEAERQRRITKEEADQRRAEEAVLAAQRDKENREYMLRLSAGMRQAPAPTVTEILKDGKLVKIDARTGRVIGDAPTPGQGKAMSATAQKELIQTDEEIQGGQAALQSLQQAKAINDKAMGFKGAGIVSSIGTLLPEGIRPSAVDATENLDNILTAGALPQLKAIFGGMPTEGERKVLLEIQGSSSKSPAVREEIFKRAEAAARKRIEFAQKKAKSLREGTYFSGDGALVPELEDKPSLIPDMPPPGAVRRK